MAILDFSRGEISPQMRYRSDLAVYHKGSETIQNFLPTPQGGLTRRYGTQIIGDIPDVSQNSAIRTFNLGSTGLHEDIPAPGSGLTVSLNLATYDTQDRVEDLAKNTEIQILLAFSETNIISAYWINTASGIPAYLQQVWNYDAAYLRPTLGFDDTRDIRVIQIENSVYIIASGNVYELYWNITKNADSNLLWNNSSNYAIGDVVYHVYDGDTYWLECIIAHDSSTLTTEEADSDLYWKIIYAPYLSWKDVTLRVGEKLLMGTVYNDDFDPLTWNENITWVTTEDNKLGDVVIHEKRTVDVSSAADTDVVTVNGTTLTKGAAADWTTAANLATAITALSNVSASDSGDIVTIAGDMGKSLTVTKTENAGTITIANISIYYECIIAHTAGTFATDLANEKWLLMNTLSGSLSEDDTIYRVRAAAGREQTIPREIVAHQGRLILAASSRFPASMFGSEIAHYTKFGAGVNDDDPWIYTISGDRVGKILWMYVTDRLYLGTKGGIFAVSDLITPNQFLLRKVNSHSASEIEGVTAAGNLLYFQSDKKTIREVSYADQVENSYQALDLTIFATHLFKTHQAVKMVVQHSPHTIIWILRSDGVLISLSYEKTVDMIAFARHNMDGTVIDISGGVGDDLYAIVERTDDTKLFRMGKTLLTDGSNANSSLYLDGLVKFVMRDIASDFEAYVQNDDFRDFLITQSITTIALVQAKTGTLDASAVTPEIGGYASQCALRHFIVLTAINLSTNDLSAWAEITVPASWTTINFSDNNFTADDINQILIDVAASEVASPRGGAPSINLSSNVAATYLGLMAGVALHDAGWTVTLDNAGSWWDGYNLTYDANTGSGSPPAVVAYLGGASVIIEDEGTLTKTAHIFGGWNTIANGSGTTYQEDDPYTMPYVNTTLYAIWIPVYSLSYDGNGHDSGGVTALQWYQAGAAVTISHAASTSLEKTGYDMDKWNTIADGSGIDYAEGYSLPAGMPASNLLLYAQWIVATYNITYNLNGGTNHGSNPATYNIETATITFLNPTRTGYTFDAWYTDAEFTTPITQIVLGSHGDVTIYAKFIIINSTLTYDGNTNDGGTVPSAADYDYNYSVTLPGAGTMYKTGYYLQYWGTAANGSGDNYSPGTSFSMPAAAETLYAIWTLNNTYAITFNSNGGTGSMSNQNIVEGLSDNLTAIGFTKTGYTFAGWATTAGGAVAYADQASYTMGSANVTLYAKWTVISYTVSFDSNGGSAVSNQSIDYGSLVSEPSDPTRTSYNFVGWYTDETWATAWNFAVDTITGTRTLYAKWTAKVITGITLSASNTMLDANDPYDLQGEVDVVSITPSDALNKTISWSIDYGSAYGNLSSATQAGVDMIAVFNGSGTISKSVWVRCTAVVGGEYSRKGFTVNNAV